MTRALRHHGLRSLAVAAVPRSAFKMRVQKNLCAVIDLKLLFAFVAAGTTLREVETASAVKAGSV